MLSLPLLVQLFGREVVDSLERAGFDDEAAIAGAGPERLAAESGISLPVAQRIVAVVEETRGSSSGPPSERRRKPPGAPRESRRRKGAGRRPVLKTPATRIEATPAQATPTPSTPAPGDPAPEGPDPLERDPADPFVDDVALVSWMGFSSKTPSGRFSFTVADGILDHVRPESPSQEEASGIAPEKVQTPPAIPAEARAPARTLPGSFWSFGHPAGPGMKSDHEVPRLSGRPLDPQAAAGPPPRRNRHDH